MNYIGSKYSILDFITSSVEKTLSLNGEKKNADEMVFADLMAGTGVVAGTFKKLGYSVIANDNQYYSYVMLKNMLSGGEELTESRRSELIKSVNEAPEAEGFIYKNYSYGGTEGREHRRMYFSDENAKKCDGARIFIENEFKGGKITQNEYYFLLASLINSADKFANTASVYGAFLKSLKKSAQKPLVITEVAPISEGKAGKAYNEDISELIKNVSGDILYLDPPYNARQYCTNYHLLETIARYDEPEIKGVTGLREYSAQKSDFCVKGKVLETFTEIVKNADFKYIFLSYNNEGLMAFNDVEKVMSKCGKYKVYMREHRRFKADSARSAKADATVEYLHCLIKDKK